MTAWCFACGSLDYMIGVPCAECGWRGQELPDADHVPVGRRQAEEFVAAAATAEHRREHLTSKTPLLDRIASGLEHIGGLPR